MSGMRVGPVGPAVSARNAHEPPARLAQRLVGRAGLEQRSKNSLQPRPLRPSRLVDVHRQKHDGLPPAVFPPVSHPLASDDHVTGFVWDFNAVAHFNDFSLEDVLQCRPTDRRTRSSDTSVDGARAETSTLSSQAAVPRSKRLRINPKATCLCSRRQRGITAANRLLRRVRIRLTPSMILGRGDFIAGLGSRGGSWRNSGHVAVCWHKARVPQRSVQAECLHFRSPPPAR